MPDEPEVKRAVSFIDGQNLWSLLPPGGCLAVQAPLSWEQPSHRLMRETLADGGAGGAPLGSAALRQAVGSRWLYEPDFYYDLLAAESAHPDVWTTEYQHALSGETWEPFVTFPRRLLTFVVPFLLSEQVPG